MASNSPRVEDENTCAGHLVLQTVVIIVSVFSTYKIMEFLRLNKKNIDNNLFPKNSKLATRYFLTSDA